MNIIIPKDIFGTINDCIPCLLYLRSKDQFTAKDLIDKFNLNKWTPYRHLSEWKNKNWLVLLSTTSTKGGKKFSYSLSNKSHEKLLMMCKKFVEEYKIKESLLQKVKINLDKVLNKEQKTKLYSEIERFFIDFFE